MSHVRLSAHAENLLQWCRQSGSLIVVGRAEQACVEQLVHLGLVREEREPDGGSGYLARIYPAGLDTT